MKRSFKKLVSILLVVMLTMGNVMSVGVSAAEDKGSETTKEVVAGSGEENEGEKKPEEQVKQEEQAKPEEQKPETEQKSEETKEETKVETNTGNAATPAKPEVLIDFVVLDKSDIQGSEIQNIVIGLSNNNKAESATVVLKNTSTGATLTVNAKTIIDGAILFETPAADKMNAGIYQVESITFTVKGFEYSETLDNTGIKASFGVNKTANKTADGYVVPTEDTNNITPDSIEIEQEVVGELGKVKASYASNGKLTVVLDPGHGGSDSGATCTHNGVTYYERDIALQISVYCKQILDATGNFNVYLTRTDNTSTLMTRKERLEYAKAVGADVLVSVHLNSTTGQPQSTANGSEVYVPNESYNIECHSLAKATGEEILAKLVALGLTNRGVKIRNATDGDTYPDGSMADYYGINYYGKLQGIPAMIVEHCFINSTVDLSHFNSDERIRELARADAEGIMNSVKYYATKNPIFDATFYADRYADLRASFGYDYAALYKHFTEFGMKEGRQASAEFDVWSYKRQYQDLRVAFGNDLPAYYRHFENFGKREGRKGTGCTKLQNGVTKYNGVDYSAVYDYDYYSSRYGDLARAFGEDENEMLYHFINFGMREGRMGKSTFDVNSYRRQYGDLRRAFGNDLPAYYRHYMNYGRREGRAGTGCTSLQNGTTVYNGVDYSAVYDYNYYSGYGDLKGAFGEDEDAMISHFVNFGMREGRQAKANFDVNSYRRQYGDLRRAFGSDLPAYYRHYINNGRYEGRQTTGCKTLQGATTTYGGVDYSAVYDYSYYSGYGDLARAFGEDEDAMIRHFVNFGMREGRQAKSSFNVTVYRNNYADLRSAFGNNLSDYYYHYMDFGRKEGRIAA